jgi:hypothetical protein
VIPFFTNAPGIKKRRFSPVRVPNPDRAEKGALHVCMELQKNLKGLCTSARRFKKILEGLCTSAWRFKKI